MKIRLSILMCLLCLVAGKVGAQNWTWTGVTPTSGNTYYLFADLGDGTNRFLNNTTNCFDGSGKVKWTIGGSFPGNTNGSSGYTLTSNTKSGDNYMQFAIYEDWGRKVSTSATSKSGDDINLASEKENGKYKICRSKKWNVNNQRNIEVSSSGLSTSGSATACWIFVTESEVNAFNEYATAWTKLNTLYNANKENLTDNKLAIESALSASTNASNAAANTKTLNDLYNANYSVGTSYSNPILPVDMADPSVILADDGYYYVYCSEHYAGEGISVYQSADMINWNKVTNVFPSSNRPSQLGYTFLWAPEIVKIGNKYVLYIANAAWGSQSETQICAATSDKPYGPFEYKSILFSATGANGTTNAGVNNCIDPSVFVEGGNKYLIWGSWNGVWYYQLSDDGLSVTGNKQSLVSGTSGDWTKIEAPMVVKHGDYYYLIASKGATVGNSSSDITYQLVMARSSSFNGTYSNTDNKNAFSGSNSMSNLLNSNDYVLGPGHCSQIIKDKDNTEWIFYHGYMKVNGNWDLNRGRVLFASKVEWDRWVTGWPGIMPPYSSEVIEKPNVDAPTNYYTRENLQIDGYYTLCLPYASKSTDGATFYEIAGKKTVNGEITGIYVNECQTPLVAGRPYIFKASKETITVYYDGVPYVGYEGTHNGLVGNLRSESIQVPKDMYVFNSTNTIAKVETEDPNDATKVRAKVRENRAYLNLSNIDEYDESAEDSGAKISYFGFDGTESTTSIDGITTTIKTDTSVYNIMGQRVGADAKGFIIKNGKKYFVK